MKGSTWLPLLGGAVLGLALGLYYAWIVNPVEYVNSAPASLQERYREDYLALIALAYTSTGDLPRARSRLDLFALEQPADQLAALAQKRMAQPDEETHARALARLAADLETTEGVTATPSEPTLALTPGVAPATASATSRPRPTALPSPTVTPGPPFELLENEIVCDPDLRPPLLQVTVLNAEAEGIPGVEIQVLWENGEDRFFTGFKPELGPGYADFEMIATETYTVQVAAAAFPISGIASEVCTLENGEEYPGSVRLVFAQAR